MVEDESKEENKLPEDEADYLNHYIDRGPYSRAHLAQQMGIDPSSLSRILNRVSGIGMGTYRNMLRILGLRCQIVRLDEGDDFMRLGEGIRRSLFDWSATVEALRRQYAESADAQGERLAARQRGAKRAPRPTPGRRKKAGGGSGS